VSGAVLLLGGSATLVCLLLAFAPGAPVPPVPPVRPRIALRRTGDLPPALRDEFCRGCQCCRAPGPRLSPDLIRSLANRTPRAQERSRGVPKH
jgi:hypothetical protein